MFNIFSGVYTPLIKFGIVVFVVAALYGGYRYQLHKSYKEGVEVTTISYEAKILANNEVLQLKKKSTEKQLEIDLSKIKTSNETKTKALITDRDTLISRLSDRPNVAESSGANPSPATTASQPAASGKELSRSNSEFLVQFAVEAETLKLGLIQCYADYQAVKQSVESFTAK